LPLDAAREVLDRAIELAVRKVLTRVELGHLDLVERDLLYLHGASLSLLVDRMLRLPGDLPPRSVGTIHVYHQQPCLPYRPEASRTSPRPMEPQVEAARKTIGGSVKIEPSIAGAMVA